MILVMLAAKAYLYSSQESNISRVKCRRCTEVDVLKPTKVKGMDENRNVVHNSGGLGRKVY